MTDLEQLARRLEKLENEQETLRSERDQYKKLYLEMMERCRKLERGLLGQKAERLSPSDAQLSLAVLGEVLGAREPRSTSTSPRGYATTSARSRRDANHFPTRSRAWTSRCFHPKWSARVSTLSFASVRR